MSSELYSTLEYLQGIQYKNVFNNCHFISNKNQTMESD